MAKRDYYEVLGVQKGATEEEIKKAYRKIAMANHPDTHPGDAQAEERFKEASEAYEVLSDPKKKSAYDQYGFAGVDGMGGAASGGYQNVYRDFSDLFGGSGGFSDIFSSFFGGGSSSSQRRNPNGPRQGQSLRYDITIDFKEAAFGCKKEISFSHDDVCPSCHGTGGTGKHACPTCGGSGQTVSGGGFFQMSQPCRACRGTGYVVDNPCSECHGTGTIRKSEKLSVTIPAGSDDGTRLTLRGKGDAGSNGGPNGDLILVVNVRPDKYFVRDGNDVYLQVPISFVQAALGDSIQIPTIDGTDVMVDIPEGTQNGKLLRLKGKGVPSLRGGSRGDMYLKVVVETPKRLGIKEKKIMKELYDTMSLTKNPKPMAFTEN